MTQNFKPFVEQYTHAVWNEKNLNVVDQCVAQDVIIHSSLGHFHGPAEMKKIIKVWVTGFPDLYVITLAALEEGDRVALQWEAKGTHLGPFKGIAPTQKRISYAGTTVYRLANRKIAEYWAYLNLQHLLEQLNG